MACRLSLCHSTVSACIAWVPLNGLRWRESSQSSCILHVHGRQSVTLQRSARYSRRTEAAATAAATSAATVDWTVAAPLTVLELLPVVLEPFTPEELSGKEDVLNAELDDWEAALELAEDCMAEED